MHPVLFVFLGILVLVLFSGGYVFFVACRRGRELNWLDREDLERTPYGRFYEDVVSADRWIQEHEVQDVFIQSHDGLNLHGLWIPAENAKGTVLLAHGYRSTYLLDFAMVLEVYHQLGFHLLVPEQRAHGKSEGKYITFGIKESRDMLDWLTFHNRQHADLPVMLHGLSMGASTVLYLADESLPENVVGIIADCGFTSPKDIIKSVYRRLIRLPAGPSVWAAELFARVFARFSFSAKDSRRTLQHSKVPVLMIHGMADDFVPTYMTRQGYDACGGEKQLLMVAGAAHGVSFLSDPVGYAAAVMYFLKTHIKNFDLN